MTKEVTIPIEWLFEDNVEFLEEKSTLFQLEQNITNHFPKAVRRQYSTDPITLAQLDLIPFKGVKSLLATGRANNEGRQYKTTIMFNTVQYEDADSKKNITFTASDGKEYHIQPLSTRNNNVQVRCSCLDFYFRFAHYNHADGSLYGRKPAVYIRKTDTHPPVNPDKVPGVCKHILKTAQALIDNKMLKKS